MIKRVPVQTLAEPKHELVTLEGPELEILPPDRVYINPQEGTVKDGMRGHTLIDLEDAEFYEVPRTSWF